MDPRHVTGEHLMFSWITCPVCGEPTIGVCCDVLMADLGDDGGTIVRGGD